MSQLPDTQSPTTGTDIASFSSQEIKKTNCKNYGKLTSSCVYLPSIVLDKSRYILGRSMNCDIVITSSNFSPQCINTISKIHFEITCEDGKHVYLTDLSKNGTFINSILVGKGNKCALNHDDQIAIGNTGIKVYVYKKPEYLLELPLELEKKYKISKQLGNGSCGEVWLAIEKRTGKEFAIKKIMKDKDNKENGLTNPLRIQNEVRILQFIKHPCLVSIEEAIDADNAVFIVLEYMGGGELTELLFSCNNPLPEHATKSIFYQLVMGLRYLHLRNITHRDIKPGNILLQSKKLPTVVKIADFGLSKLIESTSHMSTLCGTLAFAAPEIIDPYSGPYTQQVDVWSLGVVLHKMLSNEFPFNMSSANPNNLHKLILSGSINMTSINWSKVSNNGKDLVRKMLQRNPDDRLTIHEVANHPWLSQDTKMQKEVTDLLRNDVDSTSDAYIEQPAQKKIKLD